jgi:hypothetical protein
VDLQELFRHRTPSRAAVGALVVCLHGFAAWVLMNRATSPTAGETTDSPPITWLLLPAETDENARTSSAALPASARRPIAKPRETSISVPDNSESGPAPQAPDWAGAAERAAARISRDAPARDIQPPPAAPTRPFAWDKTHTERWSAAAAGGIAIRLSDHCQLVLLPLPIGGCALGKIEPRGDLFDAMKRPVELGDWKEK